MPPKKQKQVQFDINSVEHFQEIMSLEHKQLAVVDLYLDWCGPCQCMETNFSTMYFTIEKPDDRIKFYRASENFCPEEVMTTLKHGALTCRPRFLFFYEGEKKEEVTNADYTKVEQAITKYMPAIDDWSVTHGVNPWRHSFYKPSIQKERQNEREPHDD